MKKVLPPIIFVLLLLIGTGMMVRPDVVGSWVSIGKPEKAVIVRETATAKPLSLEMVELYAEANKLGIPVWDQNMLGKGKQPSPEAQPFLDAAAGKELPVLVLRWSGGGMTVKPCPATLDGLKEEVGK